jgi:hypothetical protein
MLIYANSYKNDFEYLIYSKIHYKYSKYSKYPNIPNARNRSGRGTTGIIKL